MHRLLLALAALVAHSQFSVAAERPNLVFIIADDCTFNDIGCYGGQAHTPHIDRLATQGMRFTKCFQAAPMCSPTRHNIYTGLYPVKSGAYPNHTFAKDGTQSVVHYLKPLGYRVALSGKTHIAPRNVFPFEYSGKKNPDMDVIDTLMSESKSAGTPFCLFACSNEPHSPWNKGDASRYDPAKLKLPPYFVDTPQTRTDFQHYLAEITYYDSQVGQILDLLDKHKLADDTLVLVVSEQGSGFAFAKWTCYSMGVQSACIARWPGKIEPGTVSDAMIEYIDVLPTFLEAAGRKPPKVLQGKSFLPVLSGDKTSHKAYSYAMMTTRGIINGSPHFGIRTAFDGRYRYILNLTPETKFTNACTKSKAFREWVAKAEAGDTDAAEKVRRYHHRPGEELYDTQADWYEWHNLADSAEHAKIKSRLKDRLAAWMAENGDQGQQTELEALEHQGRARKKKSASKRKSAN